MHAYELEQRTIGRILADKAARVGDKPWLLWQERVYTYGDLERMTNRYANGFTALGIRKGDHVAVMLPNCPEFFWVIWGLGKIGAVAVPINTAAKGELLRYFIDQSDSTWMVVDEEFAERLKAVKGQLSKIRCYQYLGARSARDAVIADGRVPVIDLRDVERESEAAPPVDAVHYDDLHLIMYTGGTTGPSKGVMSPHAQAHGVGLSLVSHYGYRPDDVLYVCLPLFHGNALWYSCYPALWADAAIALAPRFSASQFWSDVRRYGATQFNTLAAMTNILWKLPASEQDRDHKLRLCMTVPVPKEIYDEFEARYHVTITAVYAMTETFPVTLYTPHEPADKHGSAGKPPGYVDMKIMDEHDRPLPAGQTGEICVRPQEPGLMMQGYYNMPEATLKEMRNCWFHSGDRGYVDEDGYLYFVERTKETIRRRGENISAYEVELIICRHPKVLEAAAVPVPSELGEDDLMVFLVLRPGERVTAEDIVAFCSENMAYYMVPRFIEFIDALPKTPSEKIEKYKLKKLAEERRATLWDREKMGIKVTR